MGRLATAEEIAESIVYLLADESSFIIGQAIFVDRGMSLQARECSNLPSRGMVRKNRWLSQTNFHYNCKLRAANETTSIWSGGS